MKRVGLAVFTLLLLGSMVFASTDFPSPYISIQDGQNRAIHDAETAVPQDAPGFPANQPELDEIIGDTVHVGFTYWESQHNGTCGRMIGFYDNTAMMVWTCLESSAGARHVRFNRIDNATMTAEQAGGYVVDASARAGYTSMGYNPNDGQPYPGYHATAVTGDPFESRIAAEWSVIPGVFNETSIPEYGDFEHIWPRVTFGEYDGTGYQHTVTSMNRDEDPSAAMEILYSRAEYDPAQSRFNAPEEQVLVTDNGMNIAADVAVSYDGSTVAIAQTWSRDYGIHGDEDASQMNNDVYLWVSEDGGETWDFDNPINVTDFALPNEDLLPDSLAADVDTFRAYTDVNVYIDHDDIIHVAFTAPGYFYFEGTITYTAYIFHWDNATEDVSVLADGTFWNWVAPGAWQRQVGRPSMWQDPETDILWCVYQSYGMEGWHEPDSTQWDRSDDGFSNGEIVVVASPPNSDNGDWYGRLWTKPVNITNTWGTDGEQVPNNQLAAGECRNEREPTLSLDNTGDYLHINYVLDLDAGFVVQEEGEYTNNPVVYHRVAKSDIMDAFHTNAEWVRNYPMHADSTGYWHDSYDFEWMPDDAPWEDDDPFYRGGTSVGEGEGLQPHEFNLAQNYPNPFNPTTTIEFSLAKRGHVQLAVFDVLGREVMSLTNRTLSAGQHAIVFDGSELASGVYFVQMSSGSFNKTMKMTLVK